MYSKALNTLLKIACTSPFVLIDYNTLSYSTLDYHPEITVLTVCLENLLAAGDAQLTHFLCLMEGCFNYGTPLSPRTKFF